MVQDILVELCPAKRHGEVKALRRRMLKYGEEGTAERVNPGKRPLGSGG